MKALTVQQPWAQLLVLGERRYETRTWATAHRGRLAIHSNWYFPEIDRERCLRGPFRAALARHGLGLRHLARGVILGSVELRDCLPTDELDLADLSDDEAHFGDFSTGRWAWRVSDPVVLPEPIPLAGRVGLFDVPDDLFRHALG